MRVFVTGDTHGYCNDLEEFIKYASNWDDEDASMGDDTIVVLGDSGLNYYLSVADRKLKCYVSEVFEDYNLFIIRGNHDARPEKLLEIKTVKFLGSTALAEPEYPNIKYAIDGNIYKHKGMNILTIGGAYSVDKEYRQSHNLPWFVDEQPSLEERKYIKAVYDNNDIDIILSHTCPSSWREAFRFETDLLDRETEIDTSTEDWLDTFLVKDKFKAWYFGHFHGDLEVGKKGRMLMDKIVPLTTQQP